MQREYDLVIIGGSFTARYGARMAVQQGKRVALVEPPSVEIQPFSFEEIYQVYQSQTRIPSLGYWQNQRLEVGDRNTTAGLDYSQTRMRLIQPEFDLAGLSQLGVDVIIGRGEFQKFPQLTFVVEKRVLRSQYYLLAPELISIPPEIPGLEEGSYIIPAELEAKLAGELMHNPETNPETLARSWVVMGNPYRAAVMSQFLRDRGLAVTLVSPKLRLFPQEDGDANALLQGEIEAQGIRLLTHSPVTMIRYLEGKSWVQAGDQAIEAEQILLCPKQIPQTTGLNLAKVGVQINARGLVVNKYLQTANPQIYACNDQLGFGPYQATIAIKNALILRIFSVNYQQQPQIIATQPPLARIGMMEPEARQSYGKQVMILREYIKDQPLSQLRGETTGFCQLIVHSNGRILGGTIVGKRSPELISLVALAMKAGLKVGDLTQMPTGNDFLLQRTAAQWLNRKFSGRKSKFYYIWQELRSYI